MPDCTEPGRELVLAWKECDRLREVITELREELDEYKRVWGE